MKKIVMITIFLLVIVGICRIYAQDAEAETSDNFELNVGYFEFPGVTYTAMVRTVF